MSRRTLWCLLALGTLGTPGCGAGPRHGRSVVFAAGADVQSVDPLTSLSPLANQIERYVLLVTLARADSALAPQPYLARSWRWSADRRTLAFRLFTGLAWDDVRPTVARDVAWTVNAARDPRTGYPRARDLAAVVSVRDPDDSTVVVRFAAPQRTLPDVFTDLAILPAHCLDTVPPGRLRAAAWNARPVGNGPFRFVVHEANRRWVFAARRDFPRALGGAPRIDRFIVVVVDEPTTKLAALVSGELDFAGIQPAHASFVRRDPDLELLDYPLRLPYVIVFNVRRPPFERREVRLAVSLAVDRREIVAGYLYGFGTALDGPVASPALSPARPEAARRLLEGRSTPFELLTVGSGEAPLEQMLQAELARAGFEVTIRQVELSTFLDRVYGPRHEFQAAVLGLEGYTGLDALPVLAQLAGVGGRVPGDAAAAARWFRDSLPAAFLYDARGIQGMNRRVRGVRMDLRGELPTIARWWVRP